MGNLDYYPPGFGSGNDWDHVEGPLTEEEIDMICPECDRRAMIRNTWRASEPSIACLECDFQSEDYSYAK